MVVIDEQGLRTSQPFAPDAAGPLHLRARLLRAAGLDAVRHQRVRGAQGAGARSWRASSPRRRRTWSSRCRTRACRRPSASRRRAGFPYDVGLIRSHYVGRTFIEPQQSIRHFGVKLKLSAVRQVLKGKRVVVVDDSIVRGTTSRKIVKMLQGGGRAGGAPAHLVAADELALLLRHRHAEPAGAHRLQPHHRRDCPLRDGGHAGLPLAGGAGRRRWETRSATPSARRASPGSTSRAS